jgi:glyoxylase-like metal-dependent hydrolase (beta-lactamase superfamily II)
MQEIAEGVVVATEYRRITVGAIATGRGIVCVDVPPYPVEARQWYACLRDYFKQPIRYVILTDAHRDRLLGLHWFEEADIIAHDATHQAIAALPSAFVEQAADALSRDSGERLSFSGVRLRLPRVTFSQRMRVYVEENSVPVQAMPGPTPGNAWVHLSDRRVVFTGDSVVLNQPPFMAQTQSKSWLDSLTALRRPRFAADVIVPGRGPLAHKEATQQLSEIVRQARRLVQRFQRAGKPRMDIGELLPEFLTSLDVSPGEESEVHRRLRAGLEGIYDELLLEAG